MPEKNKNKPKPKKEEVQPIYTDDPNDPRLKAYQDSLIEFNESNKRQAANRKFVKDYIKNWNDGIHWYNTTKPIAGDFNNRYTAPNAYKQITSGNTGYPNGDKPIGYVEDSWSGGDSGSIKTDIYKKPVQPVIYKKSKGEQFIEGNSIPGSGRDFRHQPGGVFYDPEPIELKHPVNPYTKTITKLGLPQASTEAEPIKVPNQKAGKANIPMYMDHRGEWSEVPPTAYPYTPAQLEKMGYRISNSNNVPVKATINKYDFGGLIDYNEVSSQRNASIAEIAAQLGRNKRRTDYKSDLYSQWKDSTLFGLDSSMSAIGLGNVISSDDYNTKWGSTRGNKFNKTTGDIAKVVAPIVLSALYGPAAGAAYSGGRDALEKNANPNEFKNGGMVNKEIINIEGSAKKEGDLATMKSKGELNVDLLGNIIQNYSAFNPHPVNGIDSSSNVTVDSGTAVIPKKESKAFRNANKAERQRMILSIVSRQKAKQGPIPKAGDGHYAWQDIMSEKDAQSQLSSGGSNSSGGGNWGNYINQGMSLLGPMLKTSRGLFDKVENINPQEFAVKPNMKPSLINDTASQMMINDATNATLHNLRRLNTGPAAMVNTGVNSMKQKWTAKQEIDKVNAASKMSTAQANKQIELTNASTALKIRDMNDMNNAAKRNMLMEGANDISKYANQKQYDKAFFDTLPMMADNPQFNKWLEQQGYKKNKK